ncbi:SRPBCC family protein [Cellulomonas sp. URHB0016]
MDVHAAITIRRPIEEVFDLWADLTRLPTFMAHVEDVEVRPDGTTHWRASAPAGRTVEWDARIVESVRPTLLHWASVEGADVDNSGTVTFTEAPAGRGTEVRVDLAYRTPGGKIGELVAALFGEQPRQQVHDDLRRFKQVAETGEVVASDGSPVGTKARDQAHQRAAQPVGGQRVGVGAGE